MDNAPAACRILLRSYPIGYVVRVPDPFPRVAERREKILELISSSIAERGYPPTLGELGAELELTKLQVRRCVDQLVTLGKIERDPGVTRGIRLTA